MFRNSDMTYVMGMAQESVLARDPAGQGNGMQNGCSNGEAMLAGAKAGAGTGKPRGRKRAFRAGMLACAAFCLAAGFSAYAGGGRGKGGMGNGMGGGIGGSGRGGEIISDTSSYIGEDSALSKACQDAGVSRSKAAHLGTDLGLRDGVAVYNVRFYIDSYEYDYAINAETGAVVAYTQRWEKDKSYYVDEDGTIYRSIRQKDGKGDEKDAAGKKGSASSGTSASSGSSTGPGAGSSSRSSGKAAADSSSSAAVGEAAAKAAALKQAGLKESQIENYVCRLDQRRGGGSYQVSFTHDGKSYNCAVNASDGTVTSLEIRYTAK